MLRVVIIVVGASLGAWAYAASTSSTSHYARQHWAILEISSADLATALDSAVIVDTRDPNDYQQGHITGALSLDVAKWEELLPGFLTAWSPERSVVVYCGGQACGLSKEVALRLLIDLPEAKVFVLKGGYPGWLLYQAKKSPAAS